MTSGSADVINVNFAALQASAASLSAKANIAHPEPERPQHGRQPAQEHLDRIGQLGR